MWPYGDGQHGSLGSHLEKFQGMCFEYEESVTWTGGMVPVLQPGGSGLETAEERCHLARVLIFSQLATGEGVQPSALVWHVQFSVRNSPVGRVRSGGWWVCGVTQQALLSGLPGPYPPITAFGLN